MYKSNNNFNDYEIKITNKNNTYFIFIDELCLIVKNKDLKAGIVELENQFISLKKDYENTHDIDNFPKSRKNNITNYIWRELSIFSLKTGIIALIFSLFLVFSFTFMVNKSSQLSVVKILGSEFYKLSDILSSRLPKDDQEKKRALAEFKLYLNELKPYIEEFQRLQD